MARKKQLIIPIFIPFGGCPSKCVFCDQGTITGAPALPSVEEVKETIGRYLSTWKGPGAKEAAFYGGSFTGLPVEAQAGYLKAACGYMEKGLIDAIRVSTRPDYIDRCKAGFLAWHGVRTVELGVQSMSDEVLRLSGRDHGVTDTVAAVEVLKDSAFKVGLQFMPGLPGDTYESIVNTTKEIIALEPDFVRVYPTLVLKDTALHRMYHEGSYTPWPLDEMVKICREVLSLLKGARIPVIKFGLHPTQELAAKIAAGPFHPSFRQLVERA